MYLAKEYLFAGRAVGAGIAESIKQWLLGASPDQQERAKLILLAKAFAAMDMGKKPSEITMRDVRFNQRAFFRRWHPDKVLQEYMMVTEGELTEEHKKKIAEATHKFQDYQNNVELVERFIQQKEHFDGDLNELDNICEKLRKKFREVDETCAAQAQAKKDLEFQKQIVG